MVLPAAPRIQVDTLPGDIAISEAYEGEAGDIILTADLKVVSGRDALRQKLRICLSTQKGDDLFHPDFGNRMGELLEELMDSPWLARFLALEVIRQASIPSDDRGRVHTTLECVSRVLRVEVGESNTDPRKVRLRVFMDVVGLGPWTADVTIRLPAAEDKREARRP